MKFSFREVNENDEKLLFDWNNDPFVRRWSFSKKTILLSEHKKYLKEKIFEKNFLIWIFLYNDDPCGLIRVKINNKQGMLSYLISKQYRGKKLSSVMLSLAVNKICKQFPKISFYAQILPDNTISAKSLLRAGFVLKNSEPNKTIYVQQCI